MNNYEITELLESNYDKFGDKNYINEKVEGKFVGHTFMEFVDDVYRVANYLNSLGLKDKNIMLCGENSYNYMVSDIAIMGYVGTSVTVAKDWKYNYLKNIIKDMDASAFIYSKMKKEEVEQLKEEYKDVIFIEIESITIDKELVPLKKIENVDREKCVKIIFSSGTVGTPKAVMLTQKSMFYLRDNLVKRAPIDHTDVCYLYLPLHHAYASIPNFLYSIISGMSIYLCKNTNEIFEDLELIKPTVFSSVPIIYTKLYAICKEKNIKPSLLLGGNMKYMFCGGARIEPKVKQFLIDDNLNIMNSYGLSESSCLVCLEYSYKNTDYNTVGIIFENIEVKIDNPDKDGVGEILVRGDNLFIGYYNNIEGTKKVFDEEGFFHTGDLGYRKNDNLYIAGRKKRVIVFENGENIYPEEIEFEIKQHNGVNSAKVFEIKNEKIKAVIYTNVMLDGEEIIKEVNEKLPYYSKISEYEIVEDSVETRLKQ